MTSTLATVELRRQLQFAPGNAAQFKKAKQRFFNQIIRTRCPGSDADDGRAA